MPDSASIGVLDEILEPVGRAFSREVAEALMKVKASPAAQERISELAERDRLMAYGS